MHGPSPGAHALGARRGGRTLASLLALLLAAALLFFAAYRGLQPAGAADSSVVLLPDRGVPVQSTCHQTPTSGERSWSSPDACDPTGGAAVDDTGDGSGG
jgi:hypothetical protein